VRALLFLGLLTLAAAGEDRGDCRVRVVGPTGVPLPGIKIGRGKAEGRGMLVGRTGEDGTLVVRDLPYDGSVYLIIEDERLPALLRVTSRGFRPFHVQRGAVTGPELTIRAAKGVHAEFAFVDAETGKALREVAWAAGRGAGPPAAGARRLVFGTWPLRLGAVPDGYVTDTRHVDLGGRSLFAKELRAFVPVRRAIRIRLLVRLPDGTPAAGAFVPKKFWRANDEGVLVSGPLAYVRDEPVTITAVHRDADGTYREATWEGRLPAEHRPVVRASAWLEAVELEGVGFGMPGGNSAIGLAGGRERAVGSSAIVVTAKRFNGDPAAGATLELEPPGKLAPVTTTLDARGTARVDGLAGGIRWRVRVHGTGLLPAVRELDLDHDETMPVTLREPEPGSVAVEVVDERGRPVPFAAIRFEKEGWYDSAHEIEGGVDRVDMHVGADGRRTLRHLPAGRLRVYALYGSRHGITPCDVEPARTVRVRVQLGKVPSK